MLGQEITNSLLKSLSRAFPVQGDPWAALAQGFRLDREELLGTIEQLQEEGVILGLWGEPNPHLQDVREAVVSLSSEPPQRLPDGRVLRWKGKTPDDEWRASILAMGDKEPGEWEASEFHKIGLPFHLETGTSRLLQASSERTTLVEGPRPEVPPMAVKEARLADWLFVPRLIPVGEPLWEWLGAEVDMNAPAALETARKLVLNRIWRRLALRIDFTRAGWKGSGLATWSFDNAEEVAMAAKALVTVVGTGDVAVRPLPGEDRPALTALFLAFEEGEGKVCAEEVSRQWGRELAEWMPLELH